MACARFFRLASLAALCAAGAIIFAPRPALGVGQGNDLLPDIPAGLEYVRLQTIATGITNGALDITHAGDGSGRLFIATGTGAIRIYRNGALEPGLFLNAPGYLPAQAMSGLAFHPDFASNGKVYVTNSEDVPNAATPDYAAPQNETATAHDNILYEYTIDSGNPDALDPLTRREILRIRQSNEIHKMNDLVFGDDRFLYIAQGDGGATRSGAPTNYNLNAQNTSLPHGKILRIDVDNLGPNGRYAIPAGNPFASGAGGTCPEICAWGLRNPWRISKDRLTGEIYTAINGDITIEWIVRVALGANYGWAAKEGSYLWNPVTGEATVDPAPDPAFTPPLAQYDHNGATRAWGSCIGGFVYRGAALPGLYGKYVFSDYVAPALLAMDTATGELEIINVDPAGSQLQAFREICWGEDEAGELYIGRSSGQVYRLIASPLSPTPTPSPSPTPTPTLTPTPTPTLTPTPTPTPEPSLIRAIWRLYR